MVIEKIQATDLEVLQGLTQLAFVGSPLSELAAATNYSKPTLSRSLQRLKTKISLHVPLSIHYLERLPPILSLIHVNPRNNQQYLEKIRNFSLQKTYRLLGGQEIWYLNFGMMTETDKNLYIKTLNQLKSWSWVSSCYTHPVLDTTSQLALHLFDLDNQEWRAPHNSQLPSNTFHDSQIGSPSNQPQISKEDQELVNYFQKDLLSPIAPIAKKLRKQKNEIKQRMINLAGQAFHHHVMFNFLSLGLNRIHLFWLTNLSLESYDQVLTLFQQYPFFEATLTTSPNTLYNVLFIGRYPANLSSYYDTLISSLTSFSRKTLQLFRESMKISLI